MEKIEKPSEAKEGFLKIAVSKNGPYIVTGGVPLNTAEICNDDQGFCRTWRDVKRYPLRKRYALCRCGHSNNKPFCDGTHAKIHFDVTEAEDHKPYNESYDVFHGPDLTMSDNKHLCVHARFCLRAGGIWCRTIRQS